MIGPLAGAQALRGLQSINGMQNLSAMNGLQNLGNIQNMRSMLNMEEIPDMQGTQGLENLQGLQNLPLVENLSDQINNDPELQADLQGLVQRNQIFDENDNPNNSEISADEVANKFSNILGNYINDVNEKNRTAERAVETFASGGNIDLHSVMIASEKAGLSMQLALQMRNKIIQAYQEISRIQV